MKAHKQTSKPGIGLYTYQQAKNTTPFQYFAQIVVGSLVALLGIMVGISQYESPTRNTGWVVTSAVAIVIGTFMAHAGVIFWYRRLRKD